MHNYLWTFWFLFFHGFSIFRDVSNNIHNFSSHDFLELFYFLCLFLPSSFELAEAGLIVLADLAFKHFSRTNCEYFDLIKLLSYFSALFLYLHWWTMTNIGQWRSNIWGWKINIGQRKANIGKRKIAIRQWDDGKPTLDNRKLTLDSGTIIGQ